MRKMSLWNRILYKLRLKKIPPSVVRYGAFHEQYTKDIQKLFKEGYADKDTTFVILDDRKEDEV